MIKPFLAGINEANRNWKMVLSLLAANLLLSVPVIVPIFLLIIFTSGGTLVADQLFADKLDVLWFIDVLNHQFPGAALETVSLAPHLDEGFADDILGGRGITYEPHRETENANAVAIVERPHGALIALRNRRDQGFVGCRADQAGPPGEIKRPWSGGLHVGLLRAAA